MEKSTEIITEISREYPDLKSTAKNTICVFLLGCFCPHHKSFLSRLQQLLTCDYIPCIIMDEPIKGIDDQRIPDYSKKFRFYCRKLLKSPRRPLIFLYAANASCGKGDGARYELVALCENQKYVSLKSNLRLFEEEGSKLPAHQFSILHHIHVKDGEDFINRAIECVNFEVSNMEDILNDETDTAK